MSKTPVSQATGQLNPYITTSTRKSLFTPCRRVGLSRKYSTPNSVNNIISSTTLGSSGANSTPENKPKDEEKLESIRKSKVSKRLIGVDEQTESTSKKLRQDSNNINSLNEKTQNKIKPLVKEKQSRSSSRKLSGDKEENCFGFEPDSKVMKNAVVYIEKVNEMCSVLQRQQRKVESLSDSSEGVELITLVKQKEKKIVNKKIIPNKVQELVKLSQNLSDSEDEIPLINLKPEGQKVDVTKCEPKSEGLKEVTNQLKEPPQIKAEVKAKNFRRSLSMKKSTEQDENFLKEFASLTPPECKEISENELKALQKQVKEKKQQIEELKRAEVYKKKHDLKELSDLTIVWKNGCIEALNDLLLQLQKHKPITMEELLQKLRVPEEKISLSESGDLI